MSKDLNVGDAKDRTDIWLTPPKIIKALGPFDLDPCSPVNRPWDTALNHITELDDGLLLPWSGRVWLNPPYSKLEDWLNKMCLHGDGIGLTFARTETKAFQNWVFPFADSLFFFKGRLTFYDVNGKLAESGAGAASVLIAYGEYNSEKIHESGLIGYHIPINNPEIYIIEFNKTDKTWKVIVKEAMEELQGEATLNDIYEMVLRMSPGKVQRNRNYKAKIRQTLQFYFNRIETGKYSN